MDDLTVSTAQSILIAPIALFFKNSERIYWLYLFSAITIAYVVFIRHKTTDTQPREGFFSFLLPKSIYLHRSAIVDYKFSYLNILLRVFFIAPLFAATAIAIANQVADVIRLVTGNAGGIVNPADPAVLLIYTLATALATDAGLFLAHYWQHRIPWLWEFHKVHHSAEVLTPVTAYRMHPLDDLLAYAAGGLLSGMVAGGFLFMCSGPAAQLGVAGANLVYVLFYLAGYNLRHSHIWVDYGPFWSRIFISPAQHQIHHSAEPHHLNKNLGFAFAFWDRLAGTLYIPHGRETFRLGLGEAEQPAWRTVTQLFITPLAKLAGRFQISLAKRPKNIAHVTLFFAVLIPAYWANLSYSSIPAKPQSQVYLEDMTWNEVQQAIQAGTTAVIIPTGGTEQNGLHMVLGKHNYIVRHTAGQIASQLGNTLVAPVMAYVPEGSSTPPEGHMKYAGTLTVTEEIFAAVLESTARSLKQHGFRTIYFVGDSGGNQAAQQKVADQLTTEWKSDHVTVMNVSDYYGHHGQIAYLESQGITANQIGTHAGIRDTSELFVVQPEGVRKDLLKDNRQGREESGGSDGDTTLVSESIGHALLQLKVDAAVRQIRNNRTGAAR